MIGMVLVTHGRLAAEFVAAMEHVVGPQDAVRIVCIGPDDDMEKRRVEILGITDKADEEFMKQVARNVTNIQRGDVFDGVTHLIIDRDTKAPELHVLGDQQYTLAQPNENGWLRSGETGVELRTAAPEAQFPELSRDFGDHDPVRIE